MIEQNNNKLTAWNLATKFSKIFILIYLLLYMFPFPFTDIPFVGGLFSYYDTIFEAYTSWFGENILHFTQVEKIALTGSGDTTFDYIKFFATLTISLCLAMIAYVLPLIKNNYDKFYLIIFTYARYYLALYLLSYGLAKFFDAQFIFPDLNRLEQKFGDASPMGLLWTFMGYSKAYTVFSGICEVIGGLLLFFRRTTVLGGLISLMVMINVAILNFAYDVPVKLFSTHLVLISIFIISPNIPKLFQLFFLNKTTTLSIQKKELTNKWLKYGRLVCKSLVIIGFPAIMIIANLSYSEDQPKHNLNGTYITEEFIKLNDSISSSPKDSTKWSKFIIAGYYATVTMADNKELYYEANIDTTLQIMSLTSYSDTASTYHLKYHFINEKTLSVAGKFLSDSISAKFNVKRLADYELVKCGFNWINEYPYNR